MSATVANPGRVRAIRGAVLDVTFSGGTLPSIGEALHIDDDTLRLVAEVQSHLDSETVRAIALQATSGLRRGAAAQPTGGPLTAPVGDAVLGRLLDVIGAIHDHGPPLPADTPWLPIHRMPPPLAAQPAAWRARRFFIIGLDSAAYHR